MLGYTLGEWIIPHITDVRIKNTELAEIKLQRKKYQRYEQVFHIRGITYDQ